VKWRDATARSFAQTIDGLGKLATMLNVPYEALWEDVPGWTREKVQRVLKLAREKDPLRGLYENGDPESPEIGEGEDEPGIKENADALGVLIRAGVEPEDAAKRTGLDGVKFTGAIPVSLRPKEADAAKLEDKG
jgi:hypothetical protein